MQLEMFKDIVELPDPNQETQVCKICSKAKPWSSFHKHAFFKTRHDNRCKACFSKDAKLRRDMRTTYKSIKPEVCDCCGLPHKKSLVVDHDHNTLKFRGWLCEPCNLGIGQLGDDIEGLERALTFLRKHYETRT
jgi:hypothetical protein